MKASERKYEGDDMKMRLVSVLPIFLAASGCAALDSVTNGFGDSYALLRNGPNPQKEDTDLYLTKNTNLLLAYAADAGFATLPTQTNDWKQVGLSGFNRIDDACQAYLSEFHKRQQDKEVAQRAISSTGATTAAIMGIASASASSIAIVAASFGLANAYVDEGYDLVLMNIERSALQHLVESSQQEERKVYESETSYSRPVVIYHLQKYLLACSPANIVVRINDASRQYEDKSKPDSKGAAAVGSDAVVKSDGTVISNGTVVNPTGEIQTKSGVVVAPQVASPPAQ